MPHPTQPHTALPLLFCLFCSAQEEIHDLLGTGRGPQPVVHIREVAGGGVCLAGAAEREVHSRAEMVEVLEHGTLLRATGELRRWQPLLLGMWGGAPRIRVAAGQSRRESCRAS